MNEVLKLFFTKSKVTVKDMDNSFLADYKNIENGINTYVNWKLIKLLIEYNNAGYKIIMINGSLYQEEQEAMEIQKVLKGLKNG